jgi:dimethylaniline monooxygenase (N-oxide forming)
VHGEFRFSHQAMPQPSNSEETGGRLSGEDMRKYMENFADRFLKGRIRYNMDVLRISRHAPSKDNKTAKGWTIEVMDRKTESQFQLDYDKVVLCAGVRFHGLVAISLVLKLIVLSSLIGLQ